MTLEQYIAMMHPEPEAVCEEPAEEVVVWMPTEADEEPPF